MIVQQNKNQVLQCQMSPLELRPNSGCLLLKLPPALPENRGPKIWWNRQYLSRALADCSKIWQDDVLWILASRWIVKVHFRCPLKWSKSTYDQM